MSTNLKLGNLVTPKGASLIFGAEATDDFLDIKTENNETNSPYTIVIEEEDGEEIIPAEQISYSTGNGDGALVSTTAQGAISELNSKINATKTDVDYLNEHAFGLTKFFTDGLTEQTWEKTVSGGDPYRYRGLTGLSFENEFTPIQEGSADPNFKLRAKLVLDDALLTWMQENKISKLFLMQEQSTAKFALAWPETDLISNFPTPIGITVDVLKDNAIRYKGFAGNPIYYIVDAVSGGGGLGGSFIVTYGETPIDEVASAVEDNLNVTMLIGDLYAPLVEADVTNQKFVFSLDFPNAADPTAIGSRNIYTLDSNGYSFATYSNFSSDLYKTNDTPIDASKGYLRPIRVSTDLPTNNDGNVGDLWIVIGG